MPIDTIGPPAGFDAVVQKARVAERAGNLSLARRLYADALRLLKTANHASLAAQVMRWIGTVHRQEGDVEAAHDCYVVSLEVAVLNGDSLNRGYALNSLANLQLHAGELVSAAGLFAEARALADEQGDDRLAAMATQNQGVIANIQGDFQGALQYYHESLRLYTSLGDNTFLGRIYNNLGMIYTDLRQWARAENSFQNALEWSRSSQDTQTQLFIQVNLAELYILQGELGKARESCDAAFELAGRTEHHITMGEVHKWYGVLFRESAKYNLSETYLRSAAEIAERYSSPLLAAEVQRELAELYRIQDRNREALFALNYAHRVFADLRAELDLADVDRRLSELEELFLSIVRTWGESIESKDRYTAGHCERVADYACMLARAVGFDEQTLAWFRMGAFLHDVGKTAIPAEVLNKEGELTTGEWELMKQHTIRGVELLSSIDFPWDVRPMVRSHHERWDGSGYPDGLRGRAIPLSARILCVADVFDALTTTRSYRGAFSVDEALGIMRRDSGRIFDPELLEHFISLLAAPAAHNA